MRYIFLLIFIYCSQICLAQGSLCADAQPFCTDTTISFPAGVYSGDAEIGNEYDCLITQPNPAWYFLEIANSGIIEIDLSNSNNVDIDFILYGPWNNLGEAVADCGSFVANQVVDCSYSGNAQEVAIISNAIPGEVYILLITNYSNQATNIFGLSNSNSTGTTNCDVLQDCFINDGNITGTECEENNGSIEGILITGGDGNFNYEWQDENNTFISNNLDIYNLEAGDYYLTVQDISGCITADTFTVASNSTLDYVNFSYASTSFCKSDVINPSPNLNTNNQGIFFADQPLDLDPSTGQITISNSNPGVYNISHITSGYCPDTAIVQIEIIDNPSAEFQLSENTFCPENQTVLPNFINTPGGTFSATNNLSINNLTGEFTLSENNQGQSFTLSYQINQGDCQAVHYETIQVMESKYLDFDLINKGCKNEMININYNGTESLNNLSWNFNEASNLQNGGSGNYTLNYEATGIFEISLDAPNSECFVSAVSKSIEINELIINADTDKSIEITEQVSLNFEPNTNNDLIVNWSPDYNISCLTCLQPNVFPYVNTNYTVVVTDQITGCSTSKSFRVDVSFQKPYVPNVFSPNNDSFNDELIPIGDFSGTMEFSIFNRWGEMVFNTIDPKSGWNGLVNETPDVNENVFVWVLKYEIPNGEIFIDKGNVTLIK